MSVNKAPAVVRSRIPFFIFVFAMAATGVARADGQTLNQFLDLCDNDPITCILDLQTAIVAAQVDAGVACPIGGVTDREAQVVLKWLQERAGRDASAGNALAADMQHEAAKSLWPCD